jgi:hypothetical protein
MSTRFNDGTRHGRRSPRTFDDAMQVWRAQQAYRVQTWLYALVGVPLVLFPLSHLLQGHWASALGIVGAEVGTLWGVRWLWRRGRQWVRGWWQALALALVLSLSLSGCQDMARGVAKLYGYQGDPFPGPCAQEASIKAGTCIPPKQGGTP